MKTKYPYEFALSVASDIIAALQPSTDRIIIAGSLRRQKPFVGDIEILYIPKRADGPDPNDLFGNPISINHTDAAISALLTAGTLSKRISPLQKHPVWGEQNKLASHTPTGIPVDLFATKLESWHNYLVCRTGCAEMNTLIATRAKIAGLQWSPYGAGFLDRRTGQLAIRVTDEADVFEAVGLPCLPPAKRTAEMAAALARTPPHQNSTSLV